MGVRIIAGNGEGDSGTYAVLYCSVSMWAFGPVFADENQAQEFLDWLGPVDPRTFGDAEMHHRYYSFLEWIEARDKAAAQERSDADVP